MKISSALFQTCRPLILASSSPRRRDMLQGIGLDFTVKPAMVDETPLTGEAPDGFAARMANTKAEAVSSTRRDACVIAADTVVTLQGEILGKPRDAIHALTMLRQLAGATHLVVSGIALHYPGKKVRSVITETTEVTFAEATDEMLRAYIQTGEPFDKAGGYGIQGIGAFLVREIRGSYTNVVGLPLDTCLSLLLDHGIIEIAPDTCR